jgi:hypothetical protein
MFRRIQHALLLFIFLAAVSATAKPDAVLDWNDIMLTTLEGQTPANETRLAAITQLAVFEAVNAVTGRYEPYIENIRAPHSASAEAAAVASAHRVLRTYVPARATELDAARAKSLAAIADGKSREEGIVVGEEAAKAMIAARENDGSSPEEFYKPDPADLDPGEWDLTPGCSSNGGVARQWGRVTPFGLRSVRPFRADPPPSLKSWRYAAAYHEVKRVGGKDSAARPQDRADVARFYAAVLAIRTWNPVARQVAIAKGRSLSQNARALALLNMALSDALVAVFDTKYAMPFWRPETAIRAGDDDGNRATRGDPNFVPFITTPCHPSYASAHASAAYAAREILERVYGRGPHLILLSSPAVPDVTLEYRKFREITTDIDDARIYGGIHFRFDHDAGQRMGRAVGEYIHRHDLRPKYGKGSL